MGAKSDDNSKGLHSFNVNMANCNITCHQSGVPTEVAGLAADMALLKEKLPTFGWLIEYNPLAYVIETARYMLLHEGSISALGLLYTAGVTIVVFIVGLLIFNKTEKSFIDTV